MARSNPTTPSKQRGSQRSAKPKFLDAGPRLSKDQLNWALLNVGALNMPEDYQRFLLKHNGCRVEPANFTWKSPTAGKTTAHIDELLGFHPGGFDRQHEVDCTAILLRHWEDLPRGSLPIGIVDDENILLLFVAGPRHGQVWIKLVDDSGALVGEPSNPEESTYLVAKTFTKLLAALFEPIVKDAYHPVAFALDSARVRGAKLEAILKSLGCKRYRYPGMRSSSPLPLAWHWPKYAATRDVGGPAWVALERNHAEGHWSSFDERPAGYKILLVNVTVGQRRKCLAELAGALGPSAVQLDA